MFYILRNLRPEVLNYYLRTSNVMLEILKLRPVSIVSTNLTFMLIFFYSRYCFVQNCREWTRIDFKFKVICNWHI